MRFMNMLKRQAKFKKTSPRFGSRGQRLVNELRRQFPDWVASRTNGGHIKLVNPAGETVIVASSPGDRMSFLIARSLMRQAERRADGSARQRNGGRR
jgi:predicted RNA binding protein YcfA (HicA-like mRNA interferase family)